MVPEIVKQFLLEQKAGNGYFCLALDQHNRIQQCFGTPAQLGFSTPPTNLPIFDFLPILITESLDSPFEIPFYNVDESHVCNIYFLLGTTYNYLVFVDRSEIFHVTQKYQQFAHDDNITKNKFKRLAEQLEKTQKSLKESNQEKATLIAMLSHELGTPLTSILGYTELMQAHAIEPTKGLKTIHRSAKYLQHLIENTLLFGKTEAGGVQTEIESIAIKSLFEDLFATLNPAAQNKSLMLLMEYSGDEFVNIDWVRTKQILINLINNAIKYTDQGSVELTFTRDKDNYVFSIIDTGLGISKDLQDSIFNPWKRVKENNEPGSGIGLFISRKLAHAIDGEIVLKSSSKDKGSVFQLILTAKEPPQQIKEASPNPTAVNQNKSILVIDDDYDILVLIEAFLLSDNLSVFTATDYHKACEIMHAENIDLVLTDYHLGSVNASIFISDLKNRYPKLPVLLMSAIPTKSTKQNYSNIGFDDVIAKPLNKNTLLTTVYSHL
jgi:signal transduction histidine kinase/CheY-like chemotaxis protein